MRVLDDIPVMAAKDPELEAYITRRFTSVEGCRRAICTDFFRHAFDGSGADNFFDAGSCIDGRLTSAWNWCAAPDLTAALPFTLKLNVLHVGASRCGTWLTT